MALHNRDYMGGAAPSSYEPAGTSLPWLSAVWVLIAINVIVYICWVAGLTGPLVDHFLASKENLAAGRYWVLITSGFFHIDVVHLGTTLVMLYLVAKAVWSDKGGGQVVVAYLLGTVATALLLQVWGEPPWAKNGPLPPPPSGFSSGTGFYVSEKLLLTNAHVVKDSKEVSVQLAGGSIVRGTVKARNDDLDLALVTVEAAGKPLPLCEPSIKGGRTVFAYGYGVLAGTNDTLLQTRGSISAIQERKGRIVFDAKVNPGNSGGPLVDADGRWVGVVVAKSHVGQGLDSLSYAVEGRAAATWVEGAGGSVTREGAAPQGREPPDAVRASVVRLLLGKGIASATAGVAPPLLWFDHRVFGAGGATLALLVLALLPNWRRSVSQTYYVPLFFLGILFLFVDISASFRVHATPFGFGFSGHGYHLAGAGVGLILYKLDGPRGRFRAWLKARLKRLIGGKPPELKVLEGGKGKLEVPDTFPAELELPSKLDAATRARMDEILGIISEQGIDALTPAERTFLEEASKKLKE